MAHGSLSPKHLSPNLFSPLHCSASAINTTYFAVTTGKQRALIDENHGYTKTAVIAHTKEAAFTRLAAAWGSLPSAFAAECSVWRSCRARRDRRDFRHQRRKFSVSTTSATVI